jgi:hypothetical protein
MRLDDKGDWLETTEATFGSSPPRKSVEMNLYRQPFRQRAHRQKPASCAVGLPLVAICTRPRTSNALAARTTLGTQLTIKKV